MWNSWNGPSLRKGSVAGLIHIFACGFGTHIILMRAGCKVRAHILNINSEAHCSFGSEYIISLTNVICYETFL